MKRVGYWLRFAVSAAGIVLFVQQSVFAQECGTGTRRVPYNVSGGNPLFHCAETTPFPGTKISAADRDKLLYQLRLAKWALAHYENDIRESMTFENFDLNNVDFDQLGPLYNDKVTLMIDLYNSDDPVEVGMGYVKSQFTWETVANEAASKGVDKGLEYLGQYSSTAANMNPALMVVGFLWTEATVAFTTAAIYGEMFSSNWAALGGSLRMVQAWHCADDYGIYCTSADSTTCGQGMIRDLKPELASLAGILANLSADKYTGNITALENFRSQRGSVQSSVNSVREGADRVAQYAWDSWSQIRHAVGIAYGDSLTPNQKDDIADSIANSWKYDSMWLSSVLQELHRSLGEAAPSISVDEMLFLSSDSNSETDHHPLSSSDIGRDIYGFYDEHKSVVPAEPIDEEDAALVVDAGGAGDYTAIQSAVSAAQPGDIILVKGSAGSDSYHESVVITKPVILVGEAACRPVLDGEAYVDDEWHTCNGPAFTVKSDNVTIKNFRIEGYPVAGIVLTESARDCCILKNEVYRNRTAGLIASGSRDNWICGNLFWENGAGTDGDGNESWGQGSGMTLERCYGNRIYYNRFWSHAEHVYDSGSNTYDDGTYGNRWDDWTSGEYTIHGGEWTDDDVYSDREVSGGTVLDLYAHLTHLFCLTANEINALQVEFYFGDPDENGRKLGEAGVTASGGEGMAHFQWDTSGYSGTQDIYAVVDSDTVPESASVRTARVYEKLTIVDPVANGDNVIHATGLYVTTNGTYSADVSLKWVPSPYAAAIEPLSDTAELHLAGCSSAPVAGTTEDDIGSIPLIIDGTEITAIRCGSLNTANLDMTATSLALGSVYVGVIRFEDLQLPTLDLSIDSFSGEATLVIKDVSLDEVHVTNCPFCADKAAEITNGTFNRVAIENSTFVQVESNQFRQSYSGENVIYLNGCSEITVSRNVITNTDVTTCVETDQSTQIDISGNELSGAYYALDISDSEDVTIEYNSCCDTRLHGMRIENSTGFEITANDICNNDSRGIWIMGEIIRQVTGHTVSSNLISGNRTGIELEAVDGNTVTLNTIENSTTVGLRLTDSAENKIFNNNFDGNEKHAYAESVSTPNSWMDPARGGNYWSGHDASDRYAIAEQGIDEYPWPDLNGWEDPARPQISNVQITEITCSSAVVSWETDKLTTAELTCGNRTLTDSTFAHTHSFLLVGLDDQTRYSVDLLSTDFIGQQLSPTYWFTTLDCTPPVISNIGVDNILHDSVQIFWQTDEPADSRIVGGTYIEREETTQHTVAWPAYFSSYGAVLTRTHDELTVIWQAPAEPLSANSILEIGPAPGTYTESYTGKLSEARWWGKPDPSLDVFTVRIRSLTPAATYCLRFSNDQDPDKTFSEPFSVTMLPHPSIQQVNFEESESERVTNHSLALTGLSEGTEYVFIVTCRDARNNEANSVPTAFAANWLPVATFSISPQVSSDVVDHSTLITFDASAAHDRDGSIVEYLWRWGDTNWISGAGDQIKSTWSQSWAGEENKLTLKVTDDRGESSIYTREFYVRQTYTVDDDFQHGWSGGYQADELHFVLGVCNDHDLVRVYPGVYNEHVWINDSIILESAVEGGYPEINAGGSGSGIVITAPGCTVRGFEVTNFGSTFDYSHSGSRAAGIEVLSSNNVLQDNRISCGRVGISIESGSGNMLVDNTIFDQETGIFMEDTGFCHTVRKRDL